LVPIRVLVVDDHELIRRNIRRLLASETDFDLIGEASTGREAIQQSREHQPDVILLDISLPELNGLAALPFIRQAAPNARVLMVTNQDDLDFARASFAGGACGFLPKSEIWPQLAFAIRQVYSSKRFFSGGMKPQTEDLDRPIAPSLGTAET
jgi:two-component system, NarL family, nitrate/nitrite response regulator NarL